MDKTSLLQIHEQQLEKANTNNDENMKDIVSILGGIDHVLTTYLKHTDISLNEQQLNDLHNIIAPSPTKKKMDRISTLYIDNNNKDNMEIKTIPDIRKVKIALYLETDNNYLSSLFSTKYQNKISTFLHSRTSQILLIVSWILWFLTALIGIGNNIFFIVFIYVILVSLTLWIPYCIFWILSVNKQAGRFIFKSFDFWIKFIYMIQWITCEMIYRFKVLDNPYNDTPFLAFFAFLIFYIVVLMGVTSISVMDGIKIENKKWIVLLCLLVAVLTLGFSFVGQFKRYEHGDDSIVTISDGIQFSLVSRVVNSQRVIGIFVAKQAFSAYRRREKATSINLKPKLVWIEGETNNKNNDEKNMAQYLDVPDEIQMQPSVTVEAQENDDDDKL